MANGKCRITGDPLEECIDLGEQYVTDFVTRGDEKKGEAGSLKVGIGPTSRVAQLYESFPPKRMYRRYWYRSGVNELMRKDLRSIAESAVQFVDVQRGDTVLDIGSNDGTLLACYPKTLRRVGIDPADVAAGSDLYGSNGMTLLNDFFSADLYRSFTSAKARIVTVIAMFYDLEDPLGFLRQVREIIDDRGVLIIQIGYIPLVLDQNELGFINHEHVCYFTLNNLKFLLEETGFEIFDAVTNPSNGGSIRVCATPSGVSEGLACPLNWLSIGRARMIGTLEYEKKEGLGGPAPYRKFMDRIERLKEETIEWLQRQVEAGKTVIGYGASTKANVLLQYYGIATDLMPCIADRSKDKWGLCTVGTGIPIVSEDEMRAMKPDYLFAFPWFFIQSFVEREKKLLDRGTKFVLPQPKLRVVDLLIC